MRRGEIYRTQEATPERGNKPGFYVIVSRSFVAQNEDLSTVVCAPIFSEILGLRSEVVLGPDEGLPKHSAIRCDFLALMFKRKLTRQVGALSPERTNELNSARLASSLPTLHPMTRPVRCKTRYRPARYGFDRVGHSPTGLD